MFKELFSWFKKVDISNKPIPCQSCGACCGYFKVEFNREDNKQVPWEKIVVYKNGKAAMLGSEKFKGTCKSLVGEIGKDCSCSIYIDRSDVCKLFPVWLSNGKQNPKCIAARKYHGLQGKIEE